MKILCLFLLLTTYISCKSVITKVELPAAKNQIIASNTDLSIDHQWVLEKFNNVDFKNITKKSYLMIGEDKLVFTGNGGCNGIGGNLIIKGNLLKFDKVFRTQMYCMESNTMQQEDIFVNNLINTTNFKIDGAELFLYKNKELLMTLESFK
jgi:heat shock protein HslJ